MNNIDVLTAYDVALVLRISPKTVRRMAKDNELPARKVGNEWRFLKSNIEAWLSGEYSVGEQKPAGIPEVRNKQWQSMNVTVPTGSIFDTHQVANEYDDLLGLK